MFKKLFGGAKEASAPPSQPGTSAANKTINTIQSLTDHEEQLEKRKSLLEKRIEAELERAKEFSRLKKKAQALQVGPPGCCREAQLALRLTRVWVQSIW
jgi:hypothetical protein